MKKLILLIPVLLLCACPWPFLPADCQNTVEDCAQWVAHNIRFEHDGIQFLEEDYWQTPRETIENKKGDCEDVCGLFMHMVESKGNHKTFMYAVDAGLSAHAIVEVDGKIYDILNAEKKVVIYNSINDIKYKRWIYKLSYSEYITLSEKYHGYKDTKYGIWNKD
jgi:predicted small secreted protein